MELSSSPGTSSSSSPDDAELLWENTYGEGVFERVRENFRLQVSKMRDKSGVVPVLATIPVGNTIKESQTYLTLKKTCGIVGIKFYENPPLPDDSTAEQVVDCVNRFRHDPYVHYTIIPFPLPHHMDEEKILEALRVPFSPDGFPQPILDFNMQVEDPSARDFMKRFIESLKEIRAEFDIRGKRVVVIGLRNIFANTDWQFLEREHASVIYLRVSEVINCKDIIKEADILIHAPMADYGLWDLKKPGAIICSIDPMPVTTLMREILAFTCSYAAREPELTKRKKMASS